MLSCVTTYDELVSGQLAAGSALHERYIGMRERQESADNEVRRRRIDHTLHSKLEQFNEVDRSDRAQRKVDEEAQIEALAAKLRGPAR
jgi:hypothetical protein